MYDFYAYFNGTKDILGSVDPVKRKLVNLSTSNPSDGFESYVKRSDVPLIDHSLCKYVFTTSFDADITLALLHRLGNGEEASLTVCHSATSALFCTMLHVRNCGCGKVAIVAPYYFSIHRHCEALGIEYVVIPALTNKRLPVLEILAANPDAVIVTSPLYSSGEYFPEEQLCSDLMLLRGRIKWMIFDEVLALPGRELSRKITIDPSVFFIYSPHKSIGFNAFKFAEILCDKKHESAIRQVVEAFAPLNVSCVCAVDHYLSSAFSEYVSSYYNWVNRNRKIVEEIIHKSYANVPGHFVSVSGSTICPGVETYLTDLYKLATERAVAFLPPWPFWEYGFRINLLLSEDDLMKGLFAMKTLSWIQNQG